MRIIIQPIRLYAQKDNAVLYELIGALQFIGDGPNISNGNKAIVSSELDNLKVDIKNHIVNEIDRERLIRSLDSGL